MLRLLKRLYVFLSISKRKDDRLRIPVYDPKKYDSLYNQTWNCKKHDWFFFYSEIDLTPISADIGRMRISNRICQKCFLWESKRIEENTEWHFQGFGEFAHKLLTEKMIESIV